MLRDETCNTSFCEQIYDRTPNYNHSQKIIPFLSAKLQPIILFSDDYGRLYFAYKLNFGVQACIYIKIEVVDEV